MQDASKAVWSIQYVSAAFFPSLNPNFIAYRSSKVSSRPDCIFEIHQLWQSGFSRVYSSFCCSCSFEPEIIIIGQSSHKMCSNNILNFQESTTVLNTCTKKSLETYWRFYVLVETFSTNFSHKNALRQFLTFKHHAEKHSLNFKSDYSETFKRRFSLTELTKYRKIAQNNCRPRWNPSWIP